MTMRIKCPACGVPFQSKVDNGELVVWCAHGPCPSLVGDRGRKARLPWTESNERTLALTLACNIREEQDNEGDFE